MEPEVLRGRLLGPPRFLLGERELSFPFRKVEALLAYVLLEGREGTARDAMQGRDRGMGYRLALLEQLRDGRHRALSRPGR